MPHSNKSGFSILLAILTTSFLIILSAGMLYLFLQENNISQSIRKGVLVYAGTESALEYSLLKIKHHQEGFSDTITPTVDESNILLANTNDKFRPKIRYAIQASGTSYTGVIESQQMVIIPLFADLGNVIQGSDTKNPNTHTSNIQKVEQFHLNASDSVAFNIIGSIAAGNMPSEGLVGLSSSFGTTDASTTDALLKRVQNGSFVFDEHSSISGFLQNHQTNYLLVFNPNSTSITYEIGSSEKFSYPKKQITVSAQMNDFEQNVSIQQTQNDLFNGLPFGIAN